MVRISGLVLSYSRSRILAPRLREGDGRRGYRLASTSGLPGFLMSISASVLGTDILFDNKTAGFFGVR